jgi:hypothetical protein
VAKITRKEYGSHRWGVRWIEENHPSKKVRNHAARLWQAMEPVTDPNDVPEHTRKAIDKARQRLTKAIAEFRGERG